MCPYLDKFNNTCGKDYSKLDSYTLGSKCCGNPQSCPKNGGAGNSMDNLTKNMFR